MNVSEFYAFLCEKIPSELSIPGDADGMSCCPDPSIEVEKVLIALDVTPDVVEEACAEECQVILAHHPMLFGGIGSVFASSCRAGASPPTKRPLRAYG